MQAVAHGKSVPEGEGERGGGKTPAPLRPGQRHAGEQRNRSPYSHRSSTTRTRRPPLPFLSLPGGSGALCGWRSGATARRRGRRWRCGAASTALPAGSWPCAAPACSSARSAPSPPPSGWRPTGSSCCARYLRPAPPRSALRGAPGGEGRRAPPGGPCASLRSGPGGRRPGPAGAAPSKSGLSAGPAEPGCAPLELRGALRLPRFGFLNGLSHGTTAGREAGVNWRWFAT